jgi:hypothetical protein
MSEFAAGFKVFEADRFALKEMAEMATDWGACPWRTRRRRTSRFGVRAKAGSFAEQG